MGFSYTTKVRNKRGRSIIVFIGLMFSGFSAFFFYNVVWSDLQYAWQVQSWNNTQANLISAKLKRNYGDSTTYNVIAEYEYNINGQNYRNNRVAISEGADNIGDFHEVLAAKLERSFRQHQPITIWYNPKNPSDSIINREVRWGLMGFKLIFVIVFGFIGLFLVIFSFKKPKEKTFKEIKQPWLGRSEWKNGAIKSNAKKGMLGFWVFTIFWNAVSFPAVIAGIPKILAKEEYIGLIILLFPIVGVVVLFLSIKKTLEWNRFGFMPLTMDPYPGSIDGQVGGVIQANTRYDSKLIYKVTLSCIHSYMSGSGKSRSRKESVKWQDEGYAQVKPKAKGIDLEFCFNVPSNLPLSEEHSDSYNLWRLSLESEMDGIDLNRHYEVPVYSTQQQAQRLNFLSTELRPPGVAKNTAEDFLPIVNRHPIELYYPLLRKAWQQLVGVIFGGIFAGVGIFMWAKAAEEGFPLYFMGGIFSLVGFGVVFAATYAMLNSLRLKFDGLSMSYHRKFLWFTVTKVVIPYSEVRSVSASRLSSSVNSGGTHKLAYKIYLEWKYKKYMIAQDISSASKRDLVIDYFKQELKLR